MLVLVLVLVRVLVLVLVLVHVLVLVLSLLQNAKVAGSPSVPGDLRPLVSLHFYCDPPAVEGSTLDLTA